MDKRVVGFAVLAVVIGCVVLYTEAWIVGLAAAQAGPTVPRDITGSELELRGLMHGWLWFWGLPSVLGALLIGTFKPRRWALYSACAIAPGLILTVQGALGLEPHGISASYYLLSNLVNVAQLPLYLALYYALIRRHGVA